MNPLFQVIGLAFLLFPKQVPDPLALNRLQFLSDSVFVEEAIGAGNLADSFVASTSALHIWKDTHPFLELTRNIKRAYDRKPNSELLDEYQRRWTVLEESDTVTAWIDTALLAFVLDRKEEARLCLDRALEASDSNNSPYVHALMACLLSDLGELATAERHYAQSVRDASQDLPGVFRVNYEFTQSHFDRGSIADAFEGPGPLKKCLDSTYAMERVFGLYEFLLKAWGEGDQQQISNCFDQLKPLLHTAQPRTDSTFEERRYEEAAELVRRIEAAQSGDDAASMILAEESSWLDFKAEEYQEILGRLRPWKEEYPIEQYPYGNENLRNAALSVHFAYNRACSLVGEASQAVEGFRSILANIPPEENPQLVASTHCWLATHLEGRGQYREALEHKAMSLAILPTDSSFRETYTQHYTTLVRLKNHLEGTGQ